MPKYRAVIFDLDGTLVNTLFDIAESINQTLITLSLPTHSVESYRLRIGSSNRQLVADSLPPDKQHLLDTALPMQLAYYNEHFCDHSQPYSGILDMLDELKHRNFKLAVLSNKPAPFAPELTHHVFGENYFDLVLGQTQEHPLKPDHASSLFIARQFNLAPDQFAFVGDSAIDMQTARNAGMFAVGVTWGFRDRDELLQNGCQAIIDHPRDLLPLLLP